MLHGLTLHAASTPVTSAAPAADRPLHLLADAAGLAREWRDVDGRDHVVSEERLAAILTALGHSCDSEAAIREVTAQVQRTRAMLPPMLVGDAGERVPLPPGHGYRWASATDAHGVASPLLLDEGGLQAPDQPGYYTLELDGDVIQLAVAPPHCPLPAKGARRPWGASVQIPALDTGRRADFGNFAELADAAQILAGHGADALAINPVHALFPGHGHHFSPYSPSSRIFLNTAMGDPALVGLPPLPPLPASPLIAWDVALEQRLALLRAGFAALPAALRADIVAAGRSDGDLLRHAVFDALDCALRPQGARGWQDWPAPLRDPASSAVARFAADNAAEVEFHLFAQWLARESLARARESAREAGMAIGLIGDLAVGVNPGGSDCWALGDAMLRGLTIGAPPDPLGPQGQNWAITSFSPEGLRRSAYAPFIAMLRANMACGGGLRIDHAFGLARLWVIPEGGSSADGAYLSFPFADLARLVTLEAHLAGVLVIAEDLGTAPPGFTHAISQRHMLGMRVLWFERAEDQGFIGAHDYPAGSVAMTGTHDTVTVAGWWTGRDIDWAGQLGRLPDDVPREQALEIRDWDRGLLWSTFGPPEPRPAPDDPDAAVDAAIAHVAATPASLVLVPLEDLLGEVEQPNLPGTVDEHPNWRRRLAAPLDELLAQPGPARRCAMLTRPA